MIKFIQISIVGLFIWLLPIVFMQWGQQFTSTSAIELSSHEEPKTQSSDEDEIVLQHHIPQYAEMHRLDLQLPFCSGLSKGYAFRLPKPPKA